MNNYCTPFKWKRSKQSVLFINICCAIFSACAPGAYFKSPNDLNKMQATIYMKDSIVKKGFITVMNDDNSGFYNAEFTYSPPGKTKKEDITIADIDFYVIDSSTYVPKNIDLLSTGMSHLLFVKRLTDEHAKMQLYELHQRSETGDKYDYYFISLPSFSKYEVANINNSSIIPLLETKMTEIIDNCPKLANEILSAKAGYSYDNMEFLARKLSVIKRIVKEDNECWYQK